MSTMKENPDRFAIKEGTKIEYVDTPTIRDDPMKENPHTFIIRDSTMKEYPHTFIEAHIDNGCHGMFFFL